MSPRDTSIHVAAGRELSLPSRLCPREQNVLLLRYPPVVSTFPVRPVPTLWRRVGGVQASYGPVYEGDSLRSMLRKSTIAALH